MTKKNAIDGFVPRRPGSRIGGLESAKHNKPLDGVELGRAKATSDRLQPAKMQETNLGVVGDDISESLKNIDTNLDEPGKKGKKGRKKRGPLSKKRRIIKWSIIAVIVIL